MKSEIIKLKFLDFFKKNGYKELDESSIIPYKDDSLLFTNSGMVQFKNIFLGLEKYNFEKVVTIQTCIRLGGKHNDIDTIGITPHHNTSFTMLGFFCFNNASKIDTIKLAWSFLIEILKLNEDKLYITVHRNDIETYNIWINIIKINEKKITFEDDNSNFWNMEENGPCGFCSEIFYDIGNESKNLLEIWNLVFIQFNKKNNELFSLNKLFIDTGMGLERIASIKQNTFDNFDIDTMKPLSNIILKKFKIQIKTPTIKIIIDHIKTSLILIKNGLIPSNDGRGYILKKLIRRAIVKKLDLNTKCYLNELTENFLFEIYNKININKKEIELIKKIIKNEEEKFEFTLKNGIIFLKNKLKEIKNIDGKILYSLYETYGLPIEIIKNTLKNNNILVDIDNFNEEFKKNSLENKKINKKKSNCLNYNIKNTEFVGYKNIESNGKIIQINIDNKEKKNINKNDKAIIVLDKTCFYAEKGGQIGDSGILIGEKNNIFFVEKTTENKNMYFHYGKVISGSFNLNENILSKINDENRKYISINHSATHLLNAALKKILGPHIKQCGSLINNEYLRFDFLHFSELNKEELILIENTVNLYIKQKLNSHIEIINSKSNDIEKNRIVTFGKNISEEFCAGTHVSNTLEIGLFKIIKEFGIGSNIRRIEAITSYKILNLINNNNNLFEKLNKKLITSKENLLNSIDNILYENKNLKKLNFEIMLKEIKNDILNNKKYKIKNNITLIILEKEKKYTNLIKNILNSFNKTIIIIMSIEYNLTYININTSNDLDKINAMNILNELKKEFEIKGGGNNNIINGTIALEKNLNKISNNIINCINNL